MMVVPHQPIVVDREKTCPLLLRVFHKHGGHHDLEAFATRGQEPKEEVQMYTWKDATLRELTDLLKEVVPEARRREARLSFAFVYPNRQGRNVMKQVRAGGGEEEGRNVRGTLGGARGPSEGRATIVCIHVFE
ncbi:unnamed protein product [Closterium sp. Naga37s-1]|nr:unnamed protein product [Closterium sp. Naga37s-1]